MTNTDGRVVLHHGQLNVTPVSKQTQSVIAEYREEVKRLQLLNADLLEALQELLVNPWSDKLREGINNIHATNKAFAAIAKPTGS